MPNEAYVEALRQAGNLNKKALDVPPYDIIKELMNNPIIGEGGKVNTDAIKNSTLVALSLLGAGAASGAMPANSVGAFRASLKGVARRPSSLTPEMMDTLGKLNKKYEGIWGKDKLILNEFHQRYPEAKSLPIKDEGIRRAMHRQESINQGNTLTVSENPTIGAGKFEWTGEAKNHLAGLNQNYPVGSLGRDRIIADEFKKQFPNWEGRPAELTKKLNEFKNESGGSTTLGSNFGNSRGPTWFTPDKINQLRELEAMYQNLPHQARGQAITDHFRALNPDIPEHITNNRISVVRSKVKSYGGLSNATGAPSSTNLNSLEAPKPKLPIPPEDIGGGEGTTLGSNFGNYKGKSIGTYGNIPLVAGNNNTISPFGPPAGPTLNTPNPRLKTDSPGLIINELQAGILNQDPTKLLSGGPSPSTMDIIRILQQQQKQNGQIVNPQET